MNFQILKQQAKEHLRGKWGMAILASVIVGLVTNAPNLLTQYVFLNAPEIYPFVSYISIFSLFIIPIQIGLIRFFLDLQEQREANLDRVFYGFKNGKYPRNLGTMLLMSIFIALWSMLLLIPGLIKAFSYAMTPYILADPKYDNVPASSVITISRRLMDGHKLHLFGIQLYYTWWYGLAIGAAITMIMFEGNVDIAWGILGVATVIYTFYTTPLLQMATAELYQDIKQGKNRGYLSQQNMEIKQPAGTPSPVQPERPYDPLAWNYDEDPFESSEEPTKEDESPPSEHDDDEDDPFFY